MDVVVDMECRTSFLSAECGEARAMGFRRHCDLVFVCLCDGVGGDECLWGVECHGNVLPSAVSVFEQMWASMLGGMTSCISRSMMRLASVGVERKVRWLRSFDMLVVVIMLIALLDRFDDWSQKAESSCRGPNLAGFTTFGTCSRGMHFDPHRNCYKFWVV